MEENRCRVLITRSNPVAPDPRVEKLARALVDLGYEVTVVAWERFLSELPDDAGFTGRIIRLPIKAQYGRGLGNLIPLMRWQIRLFFWMRRHRTEFDIIHACDFDTVLPAILVRWLWGQPVVYDIFDFYADMLRATPAFLRSIIRRLDLWVIGRVDAIVLADQVRLEQIDGSQPKYVSIVYNTPEDWRDRIEQSFGRMSSDPFRIAFVGLLQAERGIYELLKVVESHPDWVLELAGFGGDREGILSASKGKQNVRFHGRVSYEAALQLSATGDVLVATYDPRIPNHRFSSPNKLFEAMMLGKPIIVAKGTNIDTIVRRTNCGLLVSYGEIEELDDALSRLASDIGLRDSLGANARSAYEHEFHWEMMKQKIDALYQFVNERSA